MKYTPYKNLKTSRQMKILNTTLLVLNATFTALNIIAFAYTGSTINLVSAIANAGAAYLMYKLVFNT
jgi:hypothetical protein